MRIDLNLPTLSDEQIQSLELAFDTMYAQGIIDFVERLTFPVTEEKVTQIIEELTKRE